MQITLSKIKYSKLASQETQFYTATVSVDGKPFALVANNGTGAQTHVWPLDNSEPRQQTLRDVREYLATLPKTKVKLGGRDFEFQATLGDVCDELLVNWLLDKELTALLSKAVLFIRDGKLYRLPKTARIQPLLNEGYTVLNQLTFPEALALFKEAA